MADEGVAQPAQRSGRVHAGLRMRALGEADGLILAHLRSPSSLLTSSSSEDAPDQYIHTGLRKALEAHGFEVTDLILKKWTGEGPPEPAAYLPATTLTISRHLLE